MGYILTTSSEKVVYTEDFMSMRDDFVAKMRADEPPPPVTRIRLDTIYPVYFNIFSADILVKFYFNSPKILHLNCGHLYCHQKSKHQKRNLSSQTLDYK